MFIYYIYILIIWRQIFKKISSISKLNLIFLHVYFYDKYSKNLLLTFHIILNLIFYIFIFILIFLIFLFLCIVLSPNNSKSVFHYPITSKKNVSLHSKIIHFTVKFNVFTYKSLFFSPPPRIYTKVSIQKSENRGEKVWDRSIEREKRLSP